MALSVPEAAPPPLLFFFYGSLLSGMCNHHLLSAYFGAGASAADAAAAAGVAASARCRLVGRARSVAAGHLFGLASRASPFRTFRVGGASGAGGPGGAGGAPAPVRVLGEVFAIDARCADGLARLDRLEEGYARHEIDVELLDGPAGAAAAARAWVYTVEDEGAVADLWRQTLPATPARRPRLALVESGDWASVGLRATGRAAPDEEEVVPDDDGEGGGGGNGGGGGSGGGSGGGAGAPAVLLRADSALSPAALAALAAISAAGFAGGAAGGAGAVAGVGTNGVAVTSAAAEDVDAGAGEDSGASCGDEVLRTASGFRLLVGDLRGARSAAGLERAGVTHVVNCAVSDLPSLQWAPHASPQRRYFHVVASDAVNGADADALALLSPAPQWPGAVAFLREAMASSGVALVHCWRGQNRSVTTAAVFMALSGLAPSFDAAVLAIRARRACAKPKPAFASWGRAFVDEARLLGLEAAGTAAEARAIAAAAAARRRNGLHASL